MDEDETSSQAASQGVDQQPAATQAGPMEAQLIGLATMQAQLDVPIDATQPVQPDATQPVQPDATQPVQPDAAPLVQVTADQPTSSAAAQAITLAATLPTGAATSKLAKSDSGPIGYTGARLPIPDVRPPVTFSTGLFGTMASTKSTGLGLVTSAATNLAVKAKEEQAKQLQHQIDVLQLNLLEAQLNEKRAKDEEAAQRSRTRVSEREHRLQLNEMDQKIAAKKAQLDELHAAEARLKEASTVERRMPAANDTSYWHNPWQPSTSTGPLFGAAADPCSNEDSILRSSRTPRAKRQQMEKLQEGQERQNELMERVVKLLEAKSEGKRRTKRIPSSSGTDETDQESDTTISRHTVVLRPKPKAEEVIEARAGSSTSNHDETAVHHTEAELAMVEELARARQREAQLRDQLAQARSAAAATASSSASHANTASQVDVKPPIQGTRNLRTAETGSSADAHASRFVTPLTTKHAYMDTPIVLERSESAERAVSPTARLKLPNPTMYRPFHNIDA